MTKKKLIFIFVIFMSFVLLLAGCQNTTSSKQRPTIEQLREKYPLSTGPSTSTLDITPVNFATRIKIIDCAVYATVSSDVQYVEYNTGIHALSDAEYIKKYPNDSIVQYYFYTIQVSDVVAGTLAKKEIYIYGPADSLEYTVTPKKGDRFFFTLLYSAADETIKPISNHFNINDQTSLYCGAPLYYITDGDYVLTTTDNKEMNVFNVNTTSEFKQSFIKLFSQYHKN
jgi:hypothetical protein